MPARCDTGDASLVMLQPHVVGEDGIVIAAGGTTTMLGIKRDGEKWAVARRWSVNNFLPNFSDFVIQHGCIYGLSDGVLCCLEAATGRRLWEKGRLGRGQILSLPDQHALLISSRQGELILVSVTCAGYEELARFTAIDGKTRNGPVLAGGRLFLRNGAEMAAFDVGRKPASGSAR